jgi:hypothetical protein
VARTLAFSFDGQLFKCGLEKVDRAALYGTIDVETRDEKGSPCSVAVLAQDQRTLVPQGGTALGYLSPDGRWIERAELLAVNEQGNRINTVPSSFDAPIALETKTSVARFLDHSIRSSYLLATIDSLPKPLEEALDQGQIYKFDFAYRAGVNADPAFMLKGQENALWLLVGIPNNINFVSLTQIAVLQDDADDARASADDELDFEML